MARRPAKLSVAENATFDSKLHFYTSDAAVVELNLKTLGTLGNAVVVFEAKPCSNNADDDHVAENFSIHDRTLLSVDAQVVLTKSITVDAGLPNGARGRFVPSYLLMMRPKASAQSCWWTLLLTVAHQFIPTSHI